MVVVSSSTHAVPDKVESCKAYGSSAMPSLSNIKNIKVSQLGQWRILSRFSGVKPASVHSVKIRSGQLMHTKVGISTPGQVQDAHGL